MALTKNSVLVCLNFEPEERDAHHSPQDHVNFTSELLKLLAFSSL